MSRFQLKLPDMQKEAGANIHCGGDQLKQTKNQHR